MEFTGISSSCLANPEEGRPKKPATCPERGNLGLPTQGVIPPRRAYARSVHALYNQVSRKNPDFLDGITSARFCHCDRSLRICLKELRKD